VAPYVANEREAQTVSTLMKHVMSCHSAVAVIDLYGVPLETRPSCSPGPSGFSPAPSSEAACRPASAPVGKPSPQLVDEITGWYHGQQGDT
jgi:hypothetical protein